MPAFLAINVEPEDNVDEEVDTTRELQVDDSLKLFQTALKLHAQGPRFFDEASDAYDALFESEIFKYPEAKTEYERNERRPDGTFVVEPVFAPGADVAQADVDGIGSLLPQALYLSYKNHGQFVVDRIKHRARTAPPAAAKAVFDTPEVQDDAHRALDDFNAALDRDPSDAELWRKTARVAAFLKSARISRYSLEAAVELDDDPAVVEVEPPSLAEGFAGEQLKEQLEVLDDKMALTHPAMVPFRERGLLPQLKRFLDPMPFLPNPTKSVAIPKEQSDPVAAPRLVLEISSYSWAELGTALVRFVDEHGLSGQAVLIQGPVMVFENDVQMEIDKQLQPLDSSPPRIRIADPTTTEETSAKKPKDAGSVVKEPKSATVEGVTPRDQRLPERSNSLPSRKRSQSVAGLADAQDEENADTKRSKRTRRRDTAAEEAMDPATLLATQLQPFQAADQNLFQTTKNLLENLGVTDRVTLDRLAEVLDSCASDDRTGKIQNVSTRDLRDAIVKFDDDTAKILLGDGESFAPSLSGFLEHAKAGSQRTVEPPAFDDTRGVRSFVEKSNAGWNTVHDIAYLYAMAMVQSYEHLKWSEQMKTCVVQVISHLDGSIYERVLYELEVCQTGGQEEMLNDIISLIHMLLELHLDVYERITNPNSVVDQITRIEMRERLERWLHLTTDVSRRHVQNPDDSFSLRLLWAAACSTTVAKDIARDHILTCWYSLRDYLGGSPAADISLPNNAVMSEISSAAADREISKLTTMDFFLGLFQEDMGDPASVIETLEPVLNPDSVAINAAVPETNGTNGDSGKHKTVGQPIKEVASQGLQDLWKFLQGSSTELRLLLWARLGEAYGKIEYATKQFSCLLRSIETIVADFERDDYINTPQESRKGLFMTSLKALDQLVIDSLYLALNDNSSFDIVDEDHLRSTLSALAKVNCLLHVAAMYEDEVRIGMTQATASGSTFTSFLTKLREMQVRTWSLQYTVLKVGVNQHPAIFSRPENDLADYLAAVHQVLGLRKCCKSSNKIFLKMMRIELLKQKNIENWEDYLGQVLYDLHGLKIGVGVWEVQDHGCPPETLKQKQAMALVEKISVLANRMTMKDLLKSDLKTTIEHMQQAIGSTKSTPQMMLNLRNFTEYLKTAIHPLHLYQALTGNIDLDAITINTPESAPAKQGWFFLQGMIALTKFKGVDLNRRQTPGATDDLRIGAIFLRLQLQFTPDRWDAWFRLAECFDYELDEAVLWTADKMNKDRAELVKFQRNSIHCYTLALSHSYAWASDPSAFTASEDDADALFDMYHEFGMRMYASSREPFAMEPFKHEDQERFFIETMGAGTYKKILHNQMSDYQVWKFAANLFKKAMAGKPKEWKNPYMVAKCLWKMYQKPLDALDDANRLSRPTMQTVLDALEKTVEVASALPKPRHGQDPILEPHYKILSVVYKLVRRGDLTTQEGAKILQRQQYAPDHGSEVTIGDADEWEAYVIRSLRYLRDKDKSNWQHRFIMRHARILFDKADVESDGGGYVAAKAAFAVLRENMFTKTMVMNVWKCDAERPGRHHVYTEQYIRFAVRLLAVVNDRTNLEAVLRRIRKKGVDFYHFNELWQSCVLIYVKLLRQTYDIPLTEEEAFKSLTPEEFDVLSEKITEWATKTEAEGHNALSAMREAVELKKLNANLMKAGPIDDLIADCYSAIYLELKSELPGSEVAQIKDERNQGQDEGSRTDDNTEAKGKLLNGLLGAHDRESTVLGSLRSCSEQPEKADKPLSFTGEAAPRVGRRAGVRRADILRKAEQAVARSADGPPKSAGGANGASTKPRSRLGSTSSGRNGHSVGEEENGGSGSDSDTGDENAQHPEDEDVEMRDADGDDRHGSAHENGHDDNGSEISSPPRSVHDSADDESDLSDVPADYEDDIPPSLLFPNLRKSVEMSIAAETAADGSSNQSTADEGEEIEESGEGEESEEGEEGEEVEEAEEVEEDEEGEEAKEAEVSSEVEVADSAADDDETEIEIEVGGEIDADEGIEVEDEDDEEIGEAEEAEEGEEGEEEEEEEDGEEGEEAEEVDDGEDEEGEEEGEEEEEPERRLGSPMEDDEGDTSASE
ncbi:hypothetical protein B0T24DRAFT_141648 [Lasiosphaeria ovina]|uniref:Histone transcription regulator 3 homolog n=1 Tax=Lasiosphaeria ovina TaxID=92902 RepID=A0AAE0KN06_9PEZI|nr:hypothetical protein B0T24DRAFT_141648 [Lasiosphaeria ovina]